MKDGWCIADGSYVNDGRSLSDGTVRPKRRAYRGPGWILEFLNVHHVVMESILAKSAKKIGTGKHGR